MTPVLIPVNRRDRAKERLAAVLSPQERAALASALFVDVVEAVRAAGQPLWVATSDPHLLQNGLGEDIGVIRDPEGACLNEALEHARGRLEAVGEQSVLIMLGDLPAVDPEELSSFLRRCEEEDVRVGIARAHDGGSNALYLSPPGVIPLRFGPDSAARHLAEAEQAGLRSLVVDLPSLAHDLDTVEDLEAFLIQESDTETYRVAERLELRPRLLGRAQLR